MAQNKVKAGEAYVEATLQDGKLRRSLRGLRGTFSTAGRALGRTLATGIAAGVAAIGVAAATGFGKIKSAIEETAEIDKVAKGFGLAADKASGLFAVLKASGAENARENIESLVTLSSRIGDAMAGKGAQAMELFRGLSVTAQELSQLPLDEQFFRLHEAIMQLPDPIDRVNRLMLAFGEDGGKTLIGTLSKSTEELRAQAKAMSVTKEEAEAASKAQKALNAASQAWGKLWTEIAVSLAPHMETAAASLESAFKSIESNFGSTVESMKSGWQTFVDYIAASSFVWESWWHRAQANLGKFRLAIDDFQKEHPGIFDTDPLGLDKGGENRARRRAELERQVRESEQKADQLLNQGAIVVSPKDDGVTFWRSDGIPIKTPKAINRMFETPADPISEMIASAGTFSGRAASFLGGSSPELEKMDKQIALLKDIKTNTEDGATFA